MALNKVMLIGNVGNDPEIRYLDSNPQSPQGNAKVASFRLATTERYRDRNGETRENTEWHNIVAWRSNADLVEKFVHKGSQIYVEGKLRTRQWTDQTGNKRYTTEINADNIQLLGKRPDAAQSGTDGYQGQVGTSAAPAYDAQPAQTSYNTRPVQPASNAQPVQTSYNTRPVQPASNAQPVQTSYNTRPAPEAASDDDLPF